MITITSRVGIKRVDITGLSTDEKPIDGIYNTSTFYEMDTHKVFMFDEENKRWLEQYKGVAAI